MSDTPRTDEQSDFIRDGLGMDMREVEIVPAALARTLERELNEAKARVGDSTFKALSESLAKLAVDLKAERDEARKSLLEAVAYVVNMPGVAVGDEYWTRRIKMAARWRKAAGLGDGK